MLWLLDLTINFIVEWMITRWEERSFNGASLLRLLMFLKPTAEHFIMFNVDQSISRVSWIELFQIGPMDSKSWLHKAALRIFLQGAMKMGYLGKKCEASWAGQVAQISKYKFFLCTNSSQWRFSYFGCTSSNRKGPQVTVFGPYIPMIGFWVEAFST